MEFKGKEMAKKFAIEHYGYTDSPEKAQCEVDYLYGYNQALKDSKAPEMLEMLRNIKEQLNEDDKWSVEQLIKEATTL